jgi:sortase (surface protein transpeptidase)
MFNKIITKLQQSQGIDLLGFKKRKRGVVYWSKPSTLSFILSVFAAFLIGLAVLSISVPIVPMIWYRVRPGASSTLAEILARPAVTFGDLLAASGERELEAYQPPLDPSLPKENRLRIPKIGVDTPILEESQENFEDALKRGVWRAPDFGTPYERRYPTILVAHRYGYLSWSDAYRRKNSFFSLPKLSPGDRVEIIWQQRKYTYEIYGGYESELVTDYTADLILYTCRFLESSVRIFRYAKLVKT